MICNHCHNAQTLLHSLCGKCYLLLRVDVLKKERDNSQAIVDACNASLKVALDEYGAAMRLAQPSSKIAHDYARSKPGVYCHKCWRSFESGVECVVHEEICKGPRASVVKTRAHTQRVPRTTELKVDDDLNNLG
jgi:hypothetical protein